MSDNEIKLNSGRVELRVDSQSGHGSEVRLSINDAQPPTFLTADEARQLGADLLLAAQVAERTPEAEDGAR